MIDRILAFPLAAAAYLLIAPLDPESFHFALVTQQISPFRETGKMFSLFFSLFFCFTPILHGPEARGLQYSATGLEKTLSIVAIIGTIFGALLASAYILMPQAVYLTLIYYASSAAGKLTMGILGTAFALSALFAATGLLRKPH